jgi:protein-S-isoprenylcysteine O-methyltransferase Ste14
MRAWASADRDLLIGMWLVFLTYWLVAAVGVKRTVPTGSRLQGTGVRLLALVGVVLLLRLGLRLLPRAADAAASGRSSPFGPVGGGGGVVVCALGLGIAVWARVCLGRNWGLPRTRKEGQTLVTSGPYARVRHPIYSGMLLMGLGTVLVGGLVWLVPVVLFGAYFVYSAKVEERLMARQFPLLYPEYRRRTKMLIPFVL